MQPTGSVLSTLSIRKYLLGCLNHKLLVLGQQIVHIHLEVFSDFSVSVLGTGKGNAVLVPGNYTPVDP